MVGFSKIIATIAIACFTSINAVHFCPNANDVQCVTTGGFSCAPVGSLCCLGGATFCTVASPVCCPGSTVCCLPGTTCSVDLSSCVAVTPSLVLAQLLAPTPAISHNGLAFLS